MHLRINRIARRLLATAVVALFAPVADADDLRVMSFNIRYGTADDGDNHWDNRREFLIETIRDFEPDLLGTQETLGFQKDYIADRLTEFESFGVGRDRGDDEGEMTAVFFRRDRFEKLDGGHFWLSETPDVPGSISWDSSLTRMVSWLKLRDLAADGETELFFFNTHFDHRGVQARLESAKLLRRMIDEITGDSPVIVTGDFNAGEGSEPYQALFEVDTFRVRLRDTFRELHTERGREEGTFSGFAADNITGDRIDWIGCSEHWTINSAEIDRTTREVHTPSDHWPVEAVLEIE
jgi:endonuclease/exonuclease/phosphatase family metal-dependent hydrolase